MILYQVLYQSVTKLYTIFVFADPRSHCTLLFPIYTSRIVALNPRIQRDLIYWGKGNYSQICRSTGSMKATGWVVLIPHVRGLKKCVSVR